MTHHTCLEYLNKKLLQDCIEVKERKSYWEEFYERHENGIRRNEEDFINKGEEVNNMVVGEIKLAVSE